MQRDKYEEFSKLSWYQQLNGKIADDILLLRIGQGSPLWEAVDSRSINYLVKNGLGHSWTNFLALNIIIRTHMKLDHYSTYKVTMVLNKRLKELFEHFHISKVEDWIPDDHLLQYAEKKIFVNHSSPMRSDFLMSYSNSVSHINHWIFTNFDDQYETILRQYNLPKLNFEIRGRFPLFRETIEKRVQARKSETEAIVPYFPQIRGEAHLRWNKLNRLRNKYHEVLRTIKPGTALPIEFSYYDVKGNDKAYKEKFYCRIWDNKSLISHFSLGSPEETSLLTNTNSENTYHLEFIKAERITGETRQIVDGLFFIDLIKSGALGFSKSKNHNENASKVREYLINIGYGSKEKTGSYPAPFNAPLLYPGAIALKYQPFLEGTLVNIDNLFIAASFGLAALDIFTTTGARMNELLQISNTKECINVLKMDSNTDRPKILLRMVPKGRTELENFFIGSETLKLLHKLKQIISETYNEVPTISYGGDRSHRFPEKKPYLFQWNGRHFNKAYITAYIRFLMHGLVYTTNDGKHVNLKAHLLRHAFATHSVHVEKMPVDLIARILHQKNLEVTKYYSAPTEQMISASITSWLETAATHINLGEAIKRSPLELKELFEEAKKKIGALNEVTGGVCSTDVLCPAKFSCVGCAAKIPEPSKKEQLTTTKKWAKKSKEHFLKNGQQLEARKMEQLIVDCDKELEEIRWIELYNLDESYDPSVETS